MAHLRQALPDVVLLDVNMPVMNGYEFLARMADEPAFDGVPAIVLFGPLLFPIAHQFGINEIHYAIVAVIAQNTASGASFIT